MLQFFFCFLLFAVKNTENDYFDQRLECEVPKRWSKYTTYIPLLFILLLSKYLKRNFCSFFFRSLNDSVLNMFTVQENKTNYPILHAILVENVCNIFSIFSDREQTLFHVKGTAGHQEQVKASLGYLELSGLGVHCIPNVHCATWIEINREGTF